MLLKVIMLMLLVNHIAFALEIHQCTDANGKIIFSDMPCEQEPNTVTQANKRIADKPIIKPNSVFENTAAKVNSVITANKPQIPIPVANEIDNTETNENVAKEREIAIAADKKFRVLAEQYKSDIAIDTFISKAKNKMLAADLKAIQHLYLLSSNDFVPWLHEHQAERIEAWRKAAKRGNKEAQWLLGICYVYGIISRTMYDEAEVWFRKSAEQGSVWGQTSLGIILSNKLRGKPFNLELSNQVIALFKQAAEQGFTPAQYWLGLEYQKGRGGAKDCNQTWAWWYKGAVQGNPRIQYAIGNLYNAISHKSEKFIFSIHKCNLQTDYEQAIIWYRKSAEQGYAPGQYTLGMMYKLGQGVSQDYSQAIAWFHKAAAQELVGENHAVPYYAQYQLGLMYKDGLGVAKDYEQSMMWLSKAKLLPYARSELEQLQIKK